MAQVVQSSEFVSAGSELFLDVRPDHHLPPLEGMALVRKAPLDCGFSTQILPCKLEMTSKHSYGNQV